jgi:chromosome condensin MukBEF ATPase and DNA-binding subunit MukB
MALLSEPTELRLARQSTPAVVTDAALDEAFAMVSVPERRQDLGHASRETLSEAAQLAEALREQLSSLDAQRRHLARLLDGLSS